MNFFTWLSPTMNPQVDPQMRYFGSLHAKVERAQTTLSSKNPYGAITNGSLQLCCRYIIRVDAQEDEFIFPTTEFDEPGLPCSFFVDSLLPDAHSVYLTFVVPLLWTASDSSTRTWCLVLRTISEGRFERIGFAFFDEFGVDLGRDGEAEYTISPDLLSLLTDDWEGNRDGVEMRDDEKWGKSYVIEIV